MKFDKWQDLRLSQGYLNFHAALFSLSQLWMKLSIRRVMHDYPYCLEGQVFKDVSVVCALKCCPCTILYIWCMYIYICTDIDGCTIYAYGYIKESSGVMQVGVA